MMINELMLTGSGSRRNSKEVVQVTIEEKDERGFEDSVIGTRPLVEGECMVE